MIRQVIGVDEEQIKYRTKIQNELQRGVAPIPFAWRPRHVLDGIPDLPTLWELSKKSRWEDRQLHLTMVSAEWQPVSAAKMRGLVPLLDLTSLMIIGDLDLFDALLQFFPKIAVGKATLLLLQRLLSPMSCSPFRQKCLTLQNNLKARFKFIEQPGISRREKDLFRAARWDSEEMIEAARQSGYMIFSDDLLFRIYATADAHGPPSICTLDLLIGLDEARLLPPSAVAQRIATLCSWRVGLVIPTRYQIAILPNSLGQAKSLSEGIEILQADFLCNAMFTGLWYLGKPYMELQSHAGGLLRDLIAEPTNRIESISALMGLLGRKG